MPLDLQALLDPAHSALVVNECQRGVVGDLSLLPDLAAAARGPMLANVAGLVEAARAASLPVVHCTAERRADGRGSNLNARIFVYAARAPRPLAPGSPAAQIVPEIKVASHDLVLTRLHGLSPFQGTELDSILRNLSVRTLVAAGVSVNVGIQNLAFDGVNAGYQVVIPRDGVAGFPQDYVEAVFRNSLGAVATLVSSVELLARWRS